MLLLHLLSSIAPALDANAAVIYWEISAYKSKNDYLSVKSGDNLMVYTVFIKKITNTSGDGKAVGKTCFVVLLLKGHVSDSCPQLSGKSEKH